MIPYGVAGLLLNMTKNGACLQYGAQGKFNI